MQLQRLKGKVAGFPLVPGVYFMKDGDGNILYIGKARLLKKRVGSYLKTHHDLPKVSILMSKVCDIDYVETPTEVDALLLEAQLIKKYKPKYNKELKDDKSFPLIKITGDRFPLIHLTRSKSDKRATYYGPFTDAKLLRQAITLINTLFPVRKCRTLPKTACLYYHIGQCLAPCIKPEIKPEYDRLMKEVKGFLGGGKRSFMEYLTDRMMEAADELRFEDAQFFKDQVEALGRLRKKRYSLKKGEAAIALSATLEIKRALGMDKVPEKIVCFDVSNIQGDEAVASKVSFYRELPDKLGYRRYKIKNVKGIHDYAMIQEALARMLKGLKEGRENFIPDIIMIDGGKGHLNAAKEVLIREGFEEIELISIAKRFETVYSAKQLRERPLAGGEIPFPKDWPALHLLQKVRDEAHRFAITYHRLLKGKGIEKSVLDKIPSVGSVRKRILLKHFDSLDELQRTGVEQLAGLPGMTKETAEKIWQYFHPAQ